MLNIGNGSQYYFIRYIYLFFDNADYHDDSQLDSKKVLIRQLADAVVLLPYIGILYIDMIISSPDNPVKLCCLLFVIVMRLWKATSKDVSFYFIRIMDSGWTWFNIYQSNHFKAAAFPDLLFYSFVIFNLFYIILITFIHKIWNNCQIKLW